MTEIPSLVNPLEDACPDPVALTYSLLLLGAGAGGCTRAAHSA